MDLRRSTLLTFIAQIGTAVAMFGGFVLLTRLLGPAKFGKFILFLAAVNILDMFVDAGLSGAVQKRISGGNGKNIIGTALLAKLSLFTVVATLVVGFQEVLTDFIGIYVTPWLLASLAVQQFGLTFVSSLKGELEVATAEFALFGRRVVFVVLGVGLSIHFRSVNAVLAAYLASWTAVALYAFFRVKTPTGWLSVSQLKSLLAFSKYNWLSSMVSTKIYSWADVVVVGFFLTSTHVTAYEMAWRIAGLVMMLSKSIGLTVFPTVSNWHANGDVERAEEIFPTVIVGSLLLVVPAVGGVLILSDQLLVTLFTPELAIAGSALIVLTIGKVPQSLNYVSGQMLLGLNKPEYTILPTASAIPLNIVLNIMLVSQFGIIGAAIATTLSITVTLLLTGHLLSKLITITVPFREISHLAIGASIMTVAVWLLSMTTAVQDLIDVSLIVFVGALIYFVTLLGSDKYRGIFRGLYLDVRD